MWGDYRNGGDAGEKQDLLINVKSISSTGYAFAALKEDGSVIVWGSRDRGGDADLSQYRLTDVVYVVGEGNAFAARRKNEEDIVWGQAEWYEKVLMKLHKHIEERSKVNYI